MQKTNHIAIDRKNYKTEEKFYEVVGKTIGGLMDLEQIVVSRYEDVGIYVIEFMPNKPEYGDYMPYWLLPEEEETVLYQEDDIQNNENE